jgi:hypothetical protein
MLITWNSLFELTPTNATYLKDVDDAILATKKAVKERVAAEHTFETKLDEDFSVYDQGYHKAGSSRVWARATEPAYMQPESEEVALGAGQEGEVWLKGDVDSIDVIPYVYNGTSWIRIQDKTLVLSVSTVDDWNILYSAIDSYLVYDSSYSTGSVEQPMIPLHGYLTVPIASSQTDCYVLISAWRYSPTQIKLEAYVSSFITDSFSGSYSANPSYLPRAITITITETTEAEHPFDSLSSANFIFLTQRTP